MTTISSYAFEILAVLWIITISRSILFWLNFLQVKHYRLDRIWHDIKTRSFLKLIFSKHRIILLVLLAAWEIILRSNLSERPGVFDGLFYAILIYFLINAIVASAKACRGKLQLPKFTPKVWVFFGLLISTEVSIGIAYKFWPEQLLALEILQPVIVLAVFAILYSPNYLLFSYRIKRASARRDQYKNLTVIGITGSYGKTSMKEFLAFILSRKFKVLKTPKHINVDTGIAALVLKALHSKHQVFIVEMGAYKKGEIKSIADIVKPTHAVMTGLSNQHLELFGSQANIVDAKFELVDAISNKNHIFANHDSAMLVEAFERKGIEPQWFSASDEIYDNDLFGTGNQTNLAGAIKVARAMGLNEEEIKEAVKEMPSIPRTMEKLKGPNDSLFIDDSYNANTQGVLTSLNDVKKSDFKVKIVVFKEVLELGEETDTDHKKIAESLADFDVIMLLPSRQRENMRQVLNEKGVASDRILESSQADVIKEKLNGNTVVLFEGRGSDIILKELR